MIRCLIFVRNGCNASSSSLSRNLVSFYRSEVPTVDDRQSSHCSVCCSYEVWTPLGQPRFLRQQAIKTVRTRDLRDLLQLATLASAPLPGVGVWYKMLVDSLWTDWRNVEDEAIIDAHLREHPEDSELKRSRRSVERHGLVSIGAFKRCLYPFEGAGNEEESEEEERFWNELMARNPLPPIYCEYEVSDNCVRVNSSLAD